MQTHTSIRYIGITDMHHFEATANGMVEKGCERKTH